MATVSSPVPSAARADPPPAPGVFQSFWMGGFESACQINTRKERIDMLAATQHDIQAEADYALVRRWGMRTVRDGVRWHLMEPSPGHYDFSGFLPMLHAAQRQGVQVIWNLLHYGWPDDLDFFSGAFVERFARFCRAVAQVVRAETAAVPFYVPINEMSFLAWGIGHKGIIYPYAVGRADEAKRQLVRATIAAIEALWAVDRRARLAVIDPVLHVVAPPDRPDLVALAQGQRAAQFDAWDMLAGRRHPELGGRARYLDLVGVNYYHSNEFETPDLRLRWEDTPRDRRWIPFHCLLCEIHARYQRPVFVAETSHFGAGRARWLREVAQEAGLARAAGVPLEGICLYPIIDRPDWENFDHWHNSGLFDLHRDATGRLRRVLHAEYGAALRWAQAALRQYDCR